jgi:hydroxyethylthiazole kinase-like uncharacterized protein yjeF
MDLETTSAGPRSAQPPTAGPPGQPVQATSTGPGAPSVHARKAARAQTHQVLGTGGPWPLHGTQGSRLIDRHRLKQWPHGQLMAWAGLCSARWALSMAPHARRIWVAAGPGGNGGDGLHAAMHLSGVGKDVTITLHADQHRLHPDAQTALQRALDAGCRVAEQPPHGGADLVIDALLGLGASRALSSDMAAVVQAINDQACPRLSIDLPTGLDADTGQALGGGWVRAQATLSLLTLKPGLFMGHGRDAAGSIWFNPLDDSPLTEPVDPVAWTVGPVARSGSGNFRPHASHKGRFGDVVLIGGAEGMTGALRLAAHAALAAGAGRVLAVPLHPSMTLEDGARPECMWMRPEQWPEIALEQATVVCGCGGATAVDRWLPEVLARSARLVLDADALNAVARQAALQQALQSRLARGQASVLTPHPLEAARLLGCSVQQIQADRLQAAARISRLHASTTVLKGSGTVIATPGRLPGINITGNGALATAGTGDVLAGWLAGRWSSTLHGSETPAAPDPPKADQGPDTDADRGTDAGWWAAPALGQAHRVACEAVRHHGRAADLHGTAQALRASDLVERMHRLLR